MSGNKADLIRQIAELEGIDIEIAGYDDEVFRSYDIGSTTGKLVPAARVTTLLVTRLQSRWKIDLSAITLELPGGFNTTADVLVNTQSDLRMKELRQLKEKRHEETRDVCKGQEILLSQTVRDEMKDIGARFISMYLFPDALVIVMIDRKSDTEVFDLQRNMIPVVRSLTSVKGEIVFLREVTAKLTEELLIVDGKAFPRANSFFRQD